MFFVPFLMLKFIFEINYETKLNLTSPKEVEVKIIIEKK